MRVTYYDENRGVSKETLTWRTSFLRAGIYSRDGRSFASER